MKYNSRRYLRLQWRMLKYAIENILDVDNRRTEDDQIDEDLIKCCEEHINTCLQGIAAVINE